MDQECPPGGGGGGGGDQVIMIRFVFVKVSLCSPPGPEWCSDNTARCGDC